MGIADKVIGLLLLAVAAFGQTAGTVSEAVQKTVTATAGPLTCVFTNPNTPEFTMTCSVSGTVKLTQTATPAVGAGGVVGSYVEGPESITWIVRQPTAGSVTYDIAANGVRRTGSF